MSKTVDAVYDGTALQLAEPLNLEPNTRVRVTVEAVEENKVEEAPKPYRTFRGRRVYTEEECLKMDCPFPNEPKWE